MLSRSYPPRIPATHAADQVRGTGSSEWRRWPLTARLRAAPLTRLTRKGKLIPAVVDRSDRRGPGRAAQSSRGEDAPFLPGETRETCGTTPDRMTSLCPAANPVGSMNRAADSRSISAVGFWKRAAEG
jgi:hypothetical protein